MAPARTRSTHSSTGPKAESKAKVTKTNSSPLKKRDKSRVASKYFQDDDDKVANDATLSETSRKRKQPTALTAKQKKSKKSEQIEEDEEPKPDPSQYQILKYLLSPESLDLCRPTDESKELARSRPGSDYRTYSGSAFTPFEELLSAIILSRPISHALGHRSIRTILNSPYNFNTPGAIIKAGQKRAHQSMFDARTQHKEKTAIGIARLADVVAEKFGGEDDTSLDNVREQCGYDVGKEGELLKSSIYGMGVTGLNIFFRRVQWLWKERFPFMDERTETATGALGLPDDADELYESIDAMWDLLDTDVFDGKDEEERKRRAFVVLLERIIGAHLEKKVTKVLREAEKVPEDDLDGGDEDLDDP